MLVEGAYEVAEEAAAGGWGDDALADLFGDGDDVGGGLAPGFEEVGAFGVDWVGVGGGPGVVGVDDGG
ncbi:hypothetical protein Aple_047970 [Acrocarpospora pleiomorpha]|uniref:Uncharacterized protein n=1 Tax=Acrocarpospora pleiomorpha TaxID=90975 RepID=A0A5M3XLS2_9ACTN|nr:hypothetical protein Aple_047970 [Acrocarpospora pleiomorpha]